MNKKGQIQDMMYVAFICLMIAAFGLIMYHIVDEYRTVASSELDTDNLQPVNDYVSRAPNVISGLFLIVLFGVSVIALASAFFVDSHPIFYGLMIVVLGFLSWINAIYANFWYDFSTHAEWATLSANLPIINTVLKFYPLTLFIITLIVGIIMVSK